jgi:hypothetical protein
MGRHVGIYAEYGDSRFFRNIRSCVLNTCKKTVMLYVQQFEQQNF